MVDCTESSAFSEGEESNQVLKETALVVRAQEGDQHAFAKLCEHYYIKIQRYLIRMVGNDNVGSDLTQETFLKAWKSLITLREASCFGSWLYQIARNIGLSYLRCQKQLSQISLDLYTADGDRDELSVPGPEEGVEQRELLELALSQVTPMYRKCYIFYERMGLSKQEIAEQLNLEETTVVTYIYRAKSELRQIYQELLNGQRSIPPKKRKRSILLKRRKGKANE